MFLSQNIHMTYLMSNMEMAQQSGLFLLMNLLSLKFILQNVLPAHIPDIEVLVDAITIVYDEASNGGSPHLVPMACIEAGNDHSLPNLSLRFLSTLSSLFILFSCSVPTDANIYLYKLEKEQPQSERGFFDFFSICLVMLSNYYILFCSHILNVGLWLS